jgi:hypothetical protein
VREADGEPLSVGPQRLERRFRAELLPSFDEPAIDLRDLQQPFAEVLRK